MRHIYFVFALVLGFSACNSDGSVNRGADRDVNSTEPKSNVQFLTRDGCRNTSRMLENLKAAISTGKVAVQYTLIDQGTLPPADPRNGYPTPTILMGGRDILGLPVPQQPFPEPS